MAEVKVCARCGSSISQQEIIEGKAKLADGRLVCGECAQKAAAPAARPMAQPKSTAAISLPDAEPGTSNQEPLLAGAATSGDAPAWACTPRISSKGQSGSTVR